MEHQPALYQSPISLPERTSGKISIKHSHCVDRVTIIGAREAFTRGIAPIHARLTKPLRSHNLVEKVLGNLSQSAASRFVWTQAHTDRFWRLLYRVNGATQRSRNLRKLYT